MRLAYTSRPLWDESIDPTGRAIAGLYEDPLRFLPGYVDDKSGEDGRVEVLDAYLTFAVGQNIFTHARSRSRGRTQTTGPTAKPSG
jgi:hypothetical protein